MKRKLSLCFLSAFCSASLALSAETIAEDIYSFRLSLKVPQVVDNSSSEGKRVYQTQRFFGTLNIVWKDDGAYEIRLSSLTNRTFKVNGANVTYEATTDSAFLNRFNFIGNNKTEKFKIPCLCFSVVLWPSYAKGAATEDNSFTLALAGKGYAAQRAAIRGDVVATRLSGFAVGEQGCGCSDYGHVSPTRSATIHGPGTNIEDAVATLGTWTASWRGRKGAPSP